MRKIPLLVGMLALLACSGPERVAECDPSQPNPTPCKHPVVLVPGLGASVLDVLYEESYGPIHEECERERNVWSEGIDRLWPSIEDSFPAEVPELGERKECRLDDMRVRFDPETGQFSNAPGVKVRPRGWGCVNGISNVFRFTYEGRILAHPGMSSVYERLIDELTVEHDYVIGQSLRGAPYDFRLVADETYLKDYFYALKALIEETYDKTRECPSGPKRVFVTGHSLGGPVFLYFLNTYVDRAWKDTYIQAFITFGSPWTGSPKAYRTLLSGDTEGMVGSDMEFLAAERELGGLLWMAPFQAHHADRDFVSVGGEEYGVSPEDIERVFGEIAGSPHQAHLLNRVIAPRGQTVEDPGVLLGCLHGTKLDTEAHYTYEGGGFHADPVIDRYVEGDGTVTLDVLEHCKEWDRVHAKGFPGGDHLKMLHRDDVLDHTALLMTNCWADQPDGPRDPSCPPVATTP
jgi:lysophospholipase-3